MTKIKAAETKRKEELDRELVQSKADIESAIDDFNSQMTEYWEENVKPTIEDYNATIDSINKFITEIKDKLQKFYEGKSEKWQESKKGQEYANFIEEWDKELEQLDLDEPDEIENPEIDIDEFLDIPTEIE